MDKGTISKNSRLTCRMRRRWPARGRAGPGWGPSVPGGPGAGAAPPRGARSARARGRRARARRPPCAGRPGRRPAAGPRPSRRSPPPRSPPRRPPRWRAAGRAGAAGACAARAAGRRAAPPRAARPGWAAAAAAPARARSAPPSRRTAARAAHGPARARRARGARPRRGARPPRGRRSRAGGHSRTAPRPSRGPGHGAPRPPPPPPFSPCLGEWRGSWGRRCCPTVLAGRDAVPWPTSDFPPTLAGAAREDHRRSRRFWPGPAGRRRPCGAPGASRPAARAMLNGDSGSCLRTFPRNWSLLYLSCNKQRKTKAWATGLLFKVPMRAPRRFCTRARVESRSRGTIILCVHRAIFRVDEFFPSGISIDTRGRRRRCCCPFYSSGESCFLLSGDWLLLLLVNAVPITMIPSQNVI